MKRTWILLLMTLLTGFMYAQQQDIQVYEKKEGSKVTVMARNIGKVSYKVTLQIDAKGIDVSPSTTALSVVPAGTIKQMALLIPRQGEEWSYSYEVSYMEYTGTADNTKTGRMGSAPNDGGSMSAGSSSEPVKDVTAQSSLTPTAPATLSEARIIVYTKPGCSRCEYVKKQLTEKKVSHEIVDVSVPSAEVNDMWKKLRESGFTGESVTMPVIRVDGQYHYNIKDLSQFTADLK